MKNKLNFSITSGLLLLAILVILFYAQNKTKAYSYSGFKWGSNTVGIDLSDLSFPTSWITPLAGGMSAWNGASSPFLFNSASSGHQVKCANNGTGNPVAVTNYNGSGSTITDSDTTFNTSFSWSTSGSGSAYDVQNVVTHELGHWLSLNDLSGAGDSAKTMYYSTFPGETQKRTLDTDDINGINAIYP